VILPKTKKIISQNFNTMLQEQKPRMTIALFLIRLRIATVLTQRYNLYLQKRLPKEFISDFLHEAPKTIEFFNGRLLSLVHQKVSTGKKNLILDSMKDTCISIRSRVRKSKTSTEELKHAFTVGIALRPTLKTVLQIAEAIQYGYKQHSKWANSIGIVDTDMEELQKGMNTIYEIKQNQEERKLNRQLETITKDTMQYAMEKNMSDVSEIGYLVFKRENPSIAKLFKSIMKLERVPEELKDSLNKNSPENDAKNENKNDQENKDENDSPSEGTN